jgi:hypothetical protein
MRSFDSSKPNRTAPERMIAASLLALALLCLARTTSALNCGTSISDDGCKDTRKCAKEAMTQASAYAAALQKAVIGSVDTNLAGKNKAADGTKVCVPSLTSRPPVCLANNGVCADGARKGLTCDGPVVAAAGDAECPGYCSLLPTKTCTGPAGCNPVTEGTCKSFGKGCNRSKGCNASAANDTSRCLINNDKGLAGDLTKAQRKVRTKIGAACQEFYLPDLGLPSRACKGKCTATGEQCATISDCGLCEIVGSSSSQHCAVTADCTGGGTCVIAGACVSSVDDLADCVLAGQAPDTVNARSVDTFTQALTKTAVPVKPQGAKTNKAPRKRTLISLPNLTQFLPALNDGSGPGGDAAPAYLARCTNAGASDGQPCVEDSECVRGGVKTPPAACVPDCCTCGSAGTCAPNPINGVAAGAQALCTAAGQTVCETRGSTIEPGNPIGAPTPWDPGVIKSCVVPRFARVPKITAGLDESDKGHCAGGASNGLACDSDAGCASPGHCKGGLVSFGSVNLDTGAMTSLTQAEQEVFVLTGSTPNGSACPVCAAQFCESGANALGHCSALDGRTDVACLPADDIVTWVKIGVSWIEPIALSTAATSLTADGSGKFCGYCAGDYRIGCRTDGGDSCVAKGTTGPCIATDTVPGLFGNFGYDDNPTLSGKQASVSGLANPYAPTAGGVFCVGRFTAPASAPQTSPILVRVLQPYIQNWTFSTK